jgi:hypothetical protein
VRKHASGRKPDFREVVDVNQRFIACYVTLVANAMQLAAMTPSVIVPRRRGGDHLNSRHA